MSKAKQVAAVNLSPAPNPGALIFQTTDRAVIKIHGKRKAGSASHHAPARFGCYFCRKCRSADQSCINQAPRRWVPAEANRRSELMCDDMYVLS
ncbi:hypothetical protein BU24DRAFT_429062 [Aaosphaeria arxii CBS 175.79]|uniref:Uncharacterized protein n=1 Tax=Aaosphaeria arxii CBS 175.79 TaxID=1450172 RepID=A0A6A5X791_9PLEO|nr:uncharacterized protein BU24DRAFT_429062 [Aaosphaeria arxii CBS 175.79]KAF2008756.1 hypothetical protein BU24DRAFT_429062 [Aaosphaeria arxii CBS 175.79]